MTLIKQHPLGKMFPHLGYGDLNALGKDIKENGQQNDIVMLGGKILDGYNRYRACVAAKVKPRLVEFTGNDPVHFVISQNIHRRHLSDQDKVQLIPKLLAEKSKLAEQRMKAGRKTLLSRESRVSDDQDSNRNDNTAAALVAKELNLSRGTVTRYQKIKKDADPAVVKAVHKGEITVGEGAKIAKLTPDEQREAVALPKKERRAKTRRSVQPKQDEATFEEKVSEEVERRLSAYITKELEAARKEAERYRNLKEMYANRSEQSAYVVKLLLKHQGQLRAVLNPKRAPADRNHQFLKATGTLNHIVIEAEKAKKYSEN